MDRARFDALARLLATGGSRRGTLGALLSVALLGQHPDALAERGKHHRKQKARGDGKNQDGESVQGEGRPGSAHKKHHRKQKTQRKRRKQRRQQDRRQDRDRTGGAEPGAPCVAPSDCADRLCETKACTDFQCVYTEVGDGPSPNSLCETHCCSGACCPAEAPTCNLEGLCCAPNCAGRECGPDGCGSGGTCGACPPHASCHGNGACVCIGARCEDECCAPGQVCHRSVDPNVCCTPEPKSETCPVDTCGVMINNCGQEIGCGPCEEIICTTGTCHADDHRCTYAIDPSGQPGTLCSAPRVCCAAICCPEHQVCDVSGPISVCCTPESATTCHPSGGAPRCGMVPNNCGREVDCGPCPPVVCQTGTCSAADHQCHYTSDPDQTSCTLSGGGAGICRGGQCVVNACRTIADCFQGTANACIDGLCVCGGGPACNLDAECCGTAPGGTCVNVQTDPANCGRCNNACPPGVCGVPTCSHQVCGTAPAPDNSNPGGLCGAGEVCCSGACNPVSTNPNDCGTCGNQCPRPGLPCQFTVCNDGICGFENVPNGEPGGSCTNGVCCNGECCSNPTPVCDNGVCRGCSIFGLACSPGRVCCDQSPNGDNGQCLAATCCPDFSICSAHDQCCSGTCNSRCCVGGGVGCSSNNDCCSGICRAESDGEKFCA